MPVLYLFLDKIAKILNTARLSRTNRHKVIKSEKQSGFLAHSVVPGYLKQNSTLK